MIHHYQLLEALIGCKIIDPDIALNDRILSGMPSKLINIYEAVDEMQSNGECVDFFTLQAELIKRGQLTSIGGHAYITHLITVSGLLTRPSWEHWQ
jgi:replicative DNA helicase